MAFKVRIGRLEIECENEDDLDRLVEKYGGAGGSGATDAPRGAQSGGGASGPSQAGRDQVLLRQLIQAADAGVDAGTVSNLLGGAKGRAVPLAVKQWAVRIGLASNDSNECLVTTRVRGLRGWRLSSGALGAAKAMAEGGAA